MSIINVFALTFSAIFMTLTGQAPLEIWFPLFEDLANNLLGVIM